MNGEHPDGEWLDIPSYAARTGLGIEAIRKRLQRGTLVGRKDGELWRVFCPTDQGEPLSLAPQSPQPDAAALSAQLAQLVALLSREPVPLLPPEPLCPPPDYAPAALRRRPAPRRGLLARLRAAWRS